MVLGSAKKYSFIGNLKICRKIFIIYLSVQQLVLCSLKKF